jgi:hypothetical protein
MSALTLEHLLTADASPWHAAAGAWRQLSTGLDDAAEQLIRGTRGLEDSWPLGPASEAAHTRTEHLEAEVGNSYNPARRIYDVVDRHAHGLTELRAQAEAIVASAQAAGLTVHPATGDVTAPASAYLGGNLDHTARAIAAVLAELQQILVRARDLDASTANAITVNLPAPRTGFGQLTLPPVSRDALAAQAGRPPADVRAWWESLTPAQQEQAIVDHPDLVGWLDGVPATDRDTANRRRLAGDRQRLAERQAALEARGTGDPAVAEELKRVKAQRAALDKVDNRLAQIGPTGLLLGIDPAGDGKAVVAVGNPDTARHTAVWVPGLGTEMADVPGNVTRVLNLQQAADALTPEPGDVATVMWLGYDAPETNFSVVGSERAEQGGAALDRYVDGLRATHDPGPSHLSVEGHSYGSTVVAEAALRGDGLAADDILAAGSPGMHTDKAADLRIDPRHVWAGQAEGDLVAGAGGSIWGVHGNEPSDEDFGGNRYAVDTEGHSAYWQAGSTSLRNQAAIVAGLYGLVELEHGQAPAA